MSRGERKAMIGCDQPELSLSRRCEILAISRSSFYYTPKGESPVNLALMRRIDELFLKYPFYGSRQMARQLRREGIEAGRHRVRRAGSRRLVDRLQAHEAHQSANPVTTDADAFPPQLTGHLAGAVKRILQKQLVDPTHQRQVSRALALGLVVN